MHSLLKERFSGAAVTAVILVLISSLLASKSSLTNAQNISSPIIIAAAANGNHGREMLLTASSGAGGPGNGNGNGQAHGPSNGNGGQGQGGSGYLPQQQSFEPVVPVPPPRLLKRCSSVQIGRVDKVSTEYIWELKGFLEFMDYLKDFDPTFELNSERVNFTTIPELGGTWNFRIFKEIPPTPTQGQQNAINRDRSSKTANAGGGGGAGGNSSSSAISSSRASYGHDGLNGHASSTATGSETPEMSIQAIHNWFEIITDSNPPEKRGINYKCVLVIKHENRTVLQEAKTTIADIQFKFISNGRYRHQYVYTFKWRNIQSVLGSLIAAGTSNMDVVFHFTMIAHLPSENKIVSNSCDPFS